MSQRDIAIVGLGCQFPKAPDLAAYWRNLREARVCFSEVPKWRWNHDLYYHPSPRETDKSYARKVGFLDDVRPFAALHYGLAPLRVKVMDPQHRLLVDAVRVAIEDAGYGGRPFRRDATGVFVGASVSEHKDLITSRLRAQALLDGQFGRAPALPEPWRRALTEDVIPVRAFSIAGNLLNMAAATVAQVFDLGGPAYTIDAACSSSLVATYDALLYLRAGVIDVGLACGVYLNLTPDNLVGFSRIGAISRSDRCRPFDTQADGFVLGEGVGVAVLKRLEDALRDGDRVYAVIRGAGINNDGRGEGPMTPRKEGQLAALAAAYADAGVSPDTIGLLEAHGTGTAVGDVVEVGALKEYYGSHRQGPIDCYLSSVKANVGHTMSAAGVAGLIKLSKALAEAVVPPQAAFDEPLPNLGLDEAGFHIPRALTPWGEPPGHPRRGAISSFGFGGTNCHLVLEEAPRRAVTVAVAALPGGRPELFVVSAPTAPLLAQQCRALRAALDDGEAARAPLADLAFALATRARQSAGVAFIARDVDELRRRLDDAAAVAAGETRQGIACRAAPLPEGERRVAFLFPGQGAQALDLGRALYERYPAFRAHLDALAATLDGQLPRPLLSYLYPPADADRTAATAELTATLVCQPALAALGLALARFASELGLAPSFALGHSLGEFVAAGAAGLLSPGQALAFVAARGRVMDRLALADPGAMAAVAAEPSRIAPFIAGGEVVLANLNQPQQTVISGPTDGVVAAVARLAAAGMSAQRLPVSHAFHSPLMAGVGERLAPIVAALPLGQPRCQLLSCIDPGPFPEDEAAIRELLVRHATAPVNFVDGVRAAAARGASIWIQVGAGSALLSLARATLAGGGQRPLAALSLAALEGDDGGRLLETLGELALLGLPLNLTALHDGEGRRTVQLPPTPLETVAYWCVERDERSRPSLPEIDMSKPTSTPAAPRGDEPLVALFREQMAVLQAQTEIIRRQTEVLSGAPATTLPTTMAAERDLPRAALAPAPPTPAPVAAAVGAAPAPVTVAPPPVAAVAPPPEELVLDRLIDLVARVSAFPASGIKPGQRLVADLGFDSLMVVELAAKASDLFPGLGGLPKSLFVNDTTVLELARHIAQATAKAPAAAAALPTEAPVSRYAVAGRPAPLAAPLPHAALPFAGPVAVVADRGGVAPLLEARLRAAGLPVRLLTAEAIAGLSGDDRPGAVIDLRGLDLPPRFDLATIGAAALRQPVEAAFALARSLSAGGLPTAFAVAYRDPVGAGLGGFAKALAREWPSRRLKALAAADGASPESIAHQLALELIAGDATVEVAIDAAGQRRRFELAAAPPLDPSPLPDRAVVAISGGARGLGAKLALTLARQRHARLVLLGRAAPAQVEGLLAEIHAAGGDALYFSVDVRDGAAVTHALAEGRRHFGPYLAAVHAAGVIADATVERKSPASFAQVFATKVDGALHLARATAGDPLRTLLVYGSWAGRFGNAAQTDYAAANHLLATLAAPLAAGQPGRRIVVLSLPPWDGTAMVAAIPAAARQLMAQQGVTFLDDAAGLPLVLAELEGSGPSGEVLLGRDLPAAERDEAATVRLDLATHRYLDHHRLQGVPVLPLAGALDHAAAVAERLLGARAAITDFELVDGVRLDSGPVELLSRAHAELRGGSPTVALELTARSPGSDRPSLAYRGRATLAGAPLPELSATGGEAPTLSIADFYARHTFHGPLLQGLVRIDEVGPRHIRGVVRTATPGQLVTGPAGFTVDPLLIDSAFQLAAYWALVREGRGGLPLAVAEYRPLAEVAPGSEVHCLVTLDAADNDLFVGHLDCRDAAGRLVAQLRGVRAAFRKLDAAQVPTPTVELDPSCYRVEAFPEYVALRQRLDLAAAVGIKNPYFNLHERVTNDTTVIDGRELINFSAYNYLGLSGDERVNRAVIAAVERYGTSVSASRVASGEKPLHRQLEAALARFLGCEDAIVLVGGHATNVSVIGHLFGPGDLIVHDALAHDSILGGAKLSGARRRPFPHNDWEALDRLLGEVRGQFKKVLIAIEGTYSMDGDIPDLTRFIEVKRRHHAFLLVDEAHSLGVLGATGRGIGEHFAARRQDVDLWMGTMSKSLASCGGYIAGSKAMVEYLKYTNPGFVYSVGISPANSAAALAALEILDQHPELVTTLRARARYFLERCKERGLDTGMSDGSAVVPCIVPNSWDCLQLAQALGRVGINVQPILYPAVEEHLARLRFFITSRHTEDQLRFTADAIAQELAKINPAHLKRPAPTAQPPALWSAPAPADAPAASPKS